MKLNKLFVKKQTKITQSQGAPVISDDDASANSLELSSLITCDLDDLSYSESDVSDIHESEMLSPMSEHFGPADVAETVVFQKNPKVTVITPKVKKSGLTIQPPPKFVAIGMKMVASPTDTVAPLLPIAKGPKRNSHRFSNIHPNYKIKRLPVLTIEALNSTFSEYVGGETALQYKSLDPYSEAAYLLEPKPDQKV